MTLRFRAKHDSTMRNKLAAGQQRILAVGDHQREMAKTKEGQLYMQLKAAKRSRRKVTLATSPWENKL